MPKFQPPIVRDLPDPPRNLWRIVGPGIVCAGVGLSSGEFILWPFIASQAGLIFLWGAIVGVGTQLFLNMEIERYTLATGETALTGFSKIWKHWGLILILMVYFANLWPGWMLSSATIITYLFGGGSAPVISAAGLLIIGVSLTFAPIVYVALERMIFVKVAAVGVLVVLATILVIKKETWAALPASAASFGQFPMHLGIALLFGAVAFAGAGGGQNLCQSNWIRDKGFGMGRYIPRLVSPVTGAEESTSVPVSYIFEPSDANMARWQRWWRFSNIEQASTFFIVTVITIVFTSMLAHSTLFGRTGLPNNISFLQIEGQQLKALVAPWFGVLFWAIGAFSLFATAMGVIDYTSRLAADVLKSTYLPTSKITENRLYFGLVWGLVVIGCGILLSGLAQPLVLLIISASVGGTMMCIYSALLIVINRRHLPAAIQVRSYRLWILVWATLVFGALAVLTIWQETSKLWGAR
jgi:hypothetical protein